MSTAQGRDRDATLEAETSLDRGLDDETVGALGLELRERELSGSPRPPILGQHPGLTIADAYAIQRAYLKARLEQGARLVGRKVGATNQVIQRLFGIDQPDYGVLLDEMVLADGAVLARKRLIRPRVEPEIAFLLGDRLEGPGVTPSDVLLATRALVPCLEIIDSRIEDWQISIGDTIADNGSSARVVLGDRITRPSGLDLRTLGVVIERNGEVVDTGAGAAVLGHPAASVAWLANTLGRHGDALPAGSIVLPGAMTTAVEAREGDNFIATFAILGRVSCRFE
jgi:2-oxopent-4-enoate hydratase